MSIPDIYKSFSDRTVYMADLIVETSEELSSFLKKEEVISKLYHTKYKPSKKLKLTFKHAREALLELTGLLANTRQTPLGRTHGFKGLKGMTPPEVHYITDNNLTLVADIGVHGDVTPLEKKLTIKRLRKTLSDAQQKIPVNKKRQNNLANSQKKKEINEEIDLIRRLNLLDIIRTSDKCKNIIQKQRRRLFYEFRGIWLEAPGQNWSPYKARYMSICLNTLRAGINDFLIDLYQTVGSLDIKNPKPKDFGKYLENGIGSNIQLNWSDDQLAISGWLAMSEPIDEGIMEFHVQKELGTLDFDSERINNVSEVFKNAFVRPLNWKDKQFLDGLSGCYDIFFEDKEYDWQDIENATPRGTIGNLWTDLQGNVKGSGWHEGENLIKFFGTDAYAGQSTTCPPEALTYQWYYVPDKDDIVETDGDGYIDPSEIPATAQTVPLSYTMNGDGDVTSGIWVEITNDGKALDWKGGVPDDGSAWMLTVTCDGVTYGPYISDAFCAPSNPDWEDRDDDGLPEDPEDDGPIETIFDWLLSSHSTSGSLSTEETRSYDGYLQCLTITGRLGAMDAPQSAGAIGNNATYRTDLRLMNIYNIIGEEAAYLYRYDAGDWTALATAQQLADLEDVMGHDYPDRKHKL